MSGKPMKLGTGTVYYEPDHEVALPLLNWKESQSTGRRSRPGSARKPVTKRHPASAEKAKKKTKKKRNLGSSQSGAGLFPSSAVAGGEGAAPVEQKYIMGLKERIEHLQIEVKHQKDKRKKLKHGLGSQTGAPLEDVLASLRGNFTSQQKEHENTFQELQDRVAASEEEVSRLTARNAHHVQSHQDLKKKIEALEDLVEKTKDEKLAQQVTLEQSIANLQRRLKNSTHQQKQFVKEVRDEREAKQLTIDRLNDQVKELSHVRTVQESKLIAQTKIARDLEVKVVELTGRTSVVTQPYEDAIAKLKSNKMDLELEIQGLRVALQRAESSAAKQEGICTGLVAKTGELQRVIQQQQDEAKATKARWDQMEAGGEIWSTALVDLRREKDALTVELQAVQAKLQERQQIVDSARQGLAQGIALNNELKEKLRRSKEDRETLVANDERLEAENVRLMKDLILAQDDLKQLRSKYQRDVAELESLREHNEDLGLQNQHLQERLRFAKEVDITELQNFQHMLESHAAAASNMKSIMANIRVPAGAGGSGLGASRVGSRAPSIAGTPMHVSASPFTAARSGVSTPVAVKPIYSFAATTQPAAPPTEETKAEGESSDSSGGFCISDVKLTSETAEKAKKKEKKRRQRGQPLKVRKEDPKTKIIPLMASSDSDESFAIASDDHVTNPAAAGFTGASTTATANANANAEASDSASSFCISKTEIKTNHKFKKEKKTKKKQEEEDTDDSFCIADDEVPAVTSTAKEPTVPKTDKGSSSNTDSEDFCISDVKLTSETAEKAKKKEKKRRQRGQPPKVRKEDPKEKVGALLSSDSEGDFAIASDDHVTNPAAAGFTGASTTATANANANAEASDSASSFCISKTEIKTNHKFKKEKKTKKKQEEEDTDDSFCIADDEVPAVTSTAKEPTVDSDSDPDFSISSIRIKADIKLKEKKADAAATDCGDSSSSDLEI